MPPIMTVTLNDVSIAGVEVAVRREQDEGAVVLKPQTSSLQPSGIIGNVLMWREAAIRSAQYLR